jgi:8-oxo-dGTP pyrophosphatase MutT (NUDIX family)
VLASDVRATLSDRLVQTPEIAPGPGDRLAAVLALVVEGPERSIVFTERSATLRRHPGEVSFPGGLCEPEDASLVETALREAEEEIGLDRTAPLVLGALTAVHTFVSGILVAPFVAVIPDLPTLAPVDGEIARVLTVPVASLMAAEREIAWTRPGGARWDGWLYEVEGGTIWGATGRMLHELLALLREVPA